MIVAADEWEGWQETAHLLGSPANAARLLRSIKELDAGLGQTHELVSVVANEAS